MPLSSLLARGWHQPLCPAVGGEDEAAPQGIRLVRLLNPQDSHPLKTFYAPDTDRREDHEARLSRPLFFAGGETASTRYYIKENVVRFMVRRYFIAVIQTYDHYIEVLAFEHIASGFLTRDELHELIYVITLLSGRPLTSIFIYHVIFSLALSAHAPFIAEANEVLAQAYLGVKAG